MESFEYSPTTPARAEKIILGGSYNPATLAHEAILQSAVNYARPRGAGVLVIPSGVRTDKPDAVDVEYRYDMTQAMVADVATNGVEVHILRNELDRTASVETWDTLQELTAEFPGQDLTWVFGADSTQTMGEWKHGHELLRQLRVLALQREGSVINPKLQQLQGTLEIPDLPISSTLVRAELAAGRRVDHLVGAHVLNLLMATKQLA